MQVILIRHGKTPGNALLRYNGRTDEPLSAEGIAQLKQMGADPCVGQVFVTPLQRTQQTAEILFPNAEQTVVDDLREMDFGDFEGRSYLDMENDAAYRAWVDSGSLAPCPNGEGRAEFCRRVCAAFETVICRAVAAGKQTVTFVVHGGTIMAIMERYAQPAGEFYSYRLKNAQGYRCDVIFDGQANVAALENRTVWEGNL